MLTFQSEDGATCAVYITHAEMTDNEYAIMSSLWRALSGPCGWRNLSFLASRWGYPALAECAARGWLREGRGIMSRSCTITVEGLSALVGHYVALGQNMPGIRATLAQDKREPVVTGEDSIDDVDKAWRGDGVEWTGALALSWEMQEAD